MKKNSFIIAVALIVVTYLINLLPNPNHLENISAIKAIIGMITAVLSLIFMIMSIFCSKNSLNPNNDKRILKIIKYSLLVGLVGAGIFMSLYIYRLYH